MQKRDERITDEKPNIAFHESCLPPFLTPTACRETVEEGLIMEERNTKAGVELLSLLRQQRYLYHQLKMLTDRQRQLAGAGSPEQLLEVIFGRRKLVEKLRELDEKLRPIKANWHKLSRQIEPEQKIQAHKMANQVQEILGEILAVAPSEAAQGLPLNNNCRFDELFTETQLLQ